MPDIDRYFARIGARTGHDGPRTPTLDTLRVLHAAHPVAIPFENLDPLMGRPVPLALDALERKLVEEGRGGYCFEQNTLFAAILAELGFSVTKLAARVQWSRPLTPPGPRTHMLLKVELPEGAYLADVGFGLMTLTAPLEFTPDLEQMTPHGTFRLIETGSELQLQALRGGEFVPVYQLSLEPQEAVDLELANWYTATHPRSPFTSNLSAARVSGDSRLGLADNVFARHGPAGSERRRIETAAELARVLSEEFRIRLPEGAEAALERIIASV